MEFSEMARSESSLRELEAHWRTREADRRVVAKSGLLPKISRKEADTLKRCANELADVLARLQPDKLNEEPHVEALVDRAGEWQARFFDDEVGKWSFTSREVEAQQIIADLMLCVAYSPARLPPEGEIVTASLPVLVGMAKDAIQRELPEDEPDTIPDWCYETILQVAMMGTAASQPAETRWQPIHTCKACGAECQC